MSETSLLLLFFVFVMSAVALAGYFVLARTAFIPDDASAKEFFAGTFRSLGEALPSKAGDDIRTRLVAAGYRSPNAVSIYNGVSFSAAAAVGFLTLVIVTLSSDSLSSGFVGGICLAGFTYLVSKSVLSRLIKARASRINAGLPSALDMLVLSVEAGQSLDQSIYDASREIRAAFPDLADELGQMYLALRAATSRAEVFHDFGERNHNTDLKKLTTLLIDSDRFGSSMGPALRTHARYLRVRRRQVAQEAARKVSVKLIFPIFFLIFPAVLLVTLGPAVIQLAGAFSQMTGMK